MYRKKKKKKDEERRLERNVQGGRIELDETSERGKLNYQPLLNVPLFPA